MKKFDVIVIGSGPGGYEGAIRFAQLGFKTAIVERYPRLGGTCLNVGCIPSKAWLDSTELLHKLQVDGPAQGLHIQKMDVNVVEMRDRVASVVQQTSEGIGMLMKKNKIEVFNGHASFQDKNTVQVAAEKENILLTADKIMIATGSKPTSIPGVSIDKERIITSTEALKLGEIPKHLIVIGGGVIGVELGSVFARLGAKVSIVEYMDSLIANMDSGLGKELQRALKKQGMEFYLKHAVKSAERKGDTVIVTAEARKDGKSVTLEGDYVLVATGRRPYTDGLELEKAGLKTDEKGKIPVNEHLETVVPGIFAIGDVVRGPMLAHKASEEGIYVAEYSAGQHPHINYNLIPGIVYTWPEVAGIGATEEELKTQGKEYKSGSFPFRALGRARASMDLEGFVKVLADKNTDEILGVQMIGPRIADLAAEAVTAMEFRASAEDVSRMSHGHPTYSEAVKEACLAATDNRPINI